VPEPAHPLHQLPDLRPVGAQPLAVRLG
jgi:hypothetical protein